MAPNNLVLGMITNKVIKLMEASKSDFNVAYNEFKKSCSEGYKKYNLDEIKGMIEGKVKAKMNIPACTITDCGDKDKPKKGKPKKPEVISEVPAVAAPAIIAAPAVVAAPVPAVVIPNPANKAFVLPIAQKGEGRVDYMQHKDGGIVLKKSEKKNKLAILCPEGSKGEIVDDDTIGCRLD